MFGAVGIVFVFSAWGDPPTAWRILPAKPYYDNDGPWLVCELQVFASPDCTGDPIPAAKAIGSFPDNLRFAVDGTRETIWTSIAYTAGYGGRHPARATSHEARGAWVGFEVLAADAKHGNCLRLSQGNSYSGWGVAKDIVLRIPCES